MTRGASAALAVPSNLRPLLIGSSLMGSNFLPPWGDRVKLRSGLQPASEFAQAVQTTSAQPKPLEVSAERRLVAVMFCDLVGSTSLVAKLDAEAWRNLVNAYLDEASKAVTDSAATCRRSSATD